MAKVLGFTIQIEGTKVAIDTTKELRDALTKLNKEMSNVSDAKVYDTMNKDAAKLKAELKAVTDQQRNYVREIEAGKTGAGSYQQLNAELVKLRQNYKTLSEAERSSKVGQETIKNIQQLDTKLKDIDKSMGQFQRNVGNYPQTILSGIGGLAPSLAGITNTISEIGAAAGRTGKLIAGAFGIFGIIAATSSSLFAANAAIEETQADVRKTAGLTTESVQTLTESLKNLDTRTSLDDLLKIGGALGQLGVTVNTQTIGAIDKLNVALSGELGNGAEEVATKIGILRNLLDDIQTKDIAEDYLRLGNALNVLGATGSATADVVQDFASRISGTGRALGLTSGQILGFSAAMQEAGINVERGGTGFKRVLTEITRAPETFAKVLRIPVGEFKKLVETDISGALQLVISRVKETSSTSTEMIQTLDKLKISGEGEVEVFQKLGKNVDVVNSRINDATTALTNHNSIVDEFNIKNETMGAVWERTWKKITNSAVIGGLSTVFKTVLVLFGKFIDGLKYITPGASIFDAKAKAQELIDIAKAQAEEQAKIDKRAADAKNKGGEDADLSGTKKDKSAKKVQADKDEANKLLTSQENYNRALVKISEEYSSLLIQLEEDKYRKLELEARKAFDNRQKSLNSEIETFGEKRLKERQDILKVYKEGSAQVLAFDSKTKEEESILLKNAADYEKRSEQLLSKDLLDIDKKRGEDNEKLQKETDKKSLAELKEYYDLQKSNVMTGEEVTYEEKKAAIEKIIKIEEAYLANMVLLGNEAEQTATNNRIKGLKKTLTGLTTSELKSDYDFYQNLSKQIKDADAEALDAKRAKAIEVMNLVSNVAGEIGSFIDQLNQQQLDAMDEQIAKQTDNLSMLQEKMGETTGAARVELSRQIENEKAALAKSNEQKAAAEKQAAKERQRIAIIQGVIDIASAIIANLKNPFAAIAAGVIGAIQLATISAQAFAKGGKVLSGERVNSNSGMSIRRSNGDNVLATVRTGEVVLNQQQQARLGGARTFQRIGVPGFATGGYTGDPLPRPSSDYLAGVTGGAASNNELRSLISAIDARFDRLQVHVVGEDVANELNAQSKAKKAAVI